MSYPNSNENGIEDSSTMIVNEDLKYELNQKFWDEELNPVLEKITMSEGKVTEVVMELLQYLGKENLRAIAKEANEVATEMEAF